MASRPCESMLVHRRYFPKYVSFAQANNLVMRGLVPDGSAGLSPTGSSCRAAAPGAALVPGIDPASSPWTSFLRHHRRPETRMHAPALAGKSAAARCPAERGPGPEPALAGARQNWCVPELPEVESLAIYLRERVAGRVIDPAERHGKFLDLVTLAPAAGLDGAAGSGPLHLVMHLARAGWLRWRENLPAEPPRPGKGPLAFRLRFTGGAGFDLTEAGTQKRLAVYLVADPAEVPGVAALGPDPLADSFTVEVLAGLLAGRRTQIKGVLRDQKIIAGIGNAYSDEVLHAANMSPFKLATSLTADEVA